MTIGYGNVAYAARVLGISRRPIHAGMRELEQMSNDDPEHPQRPSEDARRVRWADLTQPKYTGIPVYGSTRIPENLPNGSRTELLLQSGIASALGTDALLKLDVKRKLPDLAADRAS